MPYVNSVVERRLQLIDLRVKELSKHGTSYYAAVKFNGQTHENWSVLLTSWRTKLFLLKRAQNDQFFIFFYFFTHIPLILDIN